MASYCKLRFKQDIILAPPADAAFGTPPTIEYKAGEIVDACKEKKIGITVKKTQQITYWVATKSAPAGYKTTCGEGWYFGENDKRIEVIQDCEAKLNFNELKIELFGSPLKILLWASAVGSLIWYLLKRNRKAA